MQLGEMNALAMGSQMVPRGFHPRQRLPPCCLIPCGPAAGDPGFPFRLAVHKACGFAELKGDRTPKLLTGNAAGGMGPGGHGVEECFDNNGCGTSPGWSQKPHNLLVQARFAVLGLAQSPEAGQLMHPGHTLHAAS